MVRRGSTVRVRQRALQKPRITGFLVSVQSVSGAVGPGVEHFMELSGCKGALARRGNGLFSCLGSERPGPAGRRKLGRRGGSSERRDRVSTGFRGEEIGRASCRERV